MDQDLRTQVYNQMKNTLLFENEEERADWLNNVLPFLSEEKLGQAQKIVEEFDKKVEEIKQDELEKMNEEYIRIKVAFAKEMREKLQHKEEASRHEEENEMESLEEQLSKTF